MGFEENCVLHSVWVLKRTEKYRKNRKGRQVSLSIFRKLWLSRIQVLNCLKCQQFHASLLFYWVLIKATEFHKIYWDLIKSTDITKSTKISWPDLTFRKFWHFTLGIWILHLHDIVVALILFDFCSVFKFYMICVVSILYL